MASSKAVNDPPPNASEDKSEETWSWEWVSEGGQKEKTKASLQASKEKWEKIKAITTMNIFKKTQGMGSKVRNTLMHQLAIWIMRLEDR